MHFGGRFLKLGFLRCRGNFGRRDLEIVEGNCGGGIGPAPARNYGSTHSHKTPLPNLKAQRAYMMHGDAVDLLLPGAVDCRVFLGDKAEI